MQRWLDLTVLFLFSEKSHAEARSRKPLPVALWEDLDYKTLARAVAHLGIEPGIEHHQKPSVAQGTGPSVALSRLVGQTRPFPPPGSPVDGSTNVWGIYC